MGQIQIVQAGNPGYCIRAYSFGVFSIIQMKLDANDVAVFGDTSGYFDFKFIRLTCDVKFDLPVGSLGLVQLVHGSVIHQETGLARDTWHHLDWDEATINHEAHQPYPQLSNFTVAVAVGGSASYPDEPNQIWIDNIYLRIRCYEGS